MRRIIAVMGAVLMTVGIVGVRPAGANHCAQGDLASCPSPLTVAVVEGVGNVCESAAKQIEDEDEDVTIGGKTYTTKQLYGEKLDILDEYKGAKCKFVMDDPSWVSKPVSQWNNPAQGFYWPGVGPGGLGPAAFDIAKGAPAPPTNVCVANVGGAGCGVHAQVLLEGGDSLNAAFGGAETGAHCGSSHGYVIVRFVAGDNSVTTYGYQEWEQSAATLLPEFGFVNKTFDADGKVVEPPSGSPPQIFAFVSARGIGGAGNCGITEATTGFQVEGYSITY